jgi:hypothetical protein
MYGNSFPISFRCIARVFVVKFFSLLTRYQWVTSCRVILCALFSRFPRPFSTPRQHFLVRGLPTYPFKGVRAHFGFSHRRVIDSHFPPKMATLFHLTFSGLVVVMMMNVPEASSIPTHTHYQARRGVGGGQESWIDTRVCGGCLRRRMTLNVYNSGGGVGLVRSQVRSSKQGRCLIIISPLLPFGIPSIKHVYFM